MTTLRCGGYRGGMSDHIRNNIFPAAHAAVSDWTAIHWHTYAHLPHSSQALAFSVFGTFSASPAKDAIISRIAAEAGLEDSGPWSIELEWQDASNLLNEPRPTQVDAVAISPSSILLFECKFTEPGGQCSQVKQDARKRTPCNTRYELQTNVQNGKTARCALSGKGIRYWELIPEVYGLDADADHEPCPFAFDSYQWMRNSLMAHALQRSTGKAVRVFAAYYDKLGLPTADKVRLGHLGVPVQRAHAMIRPVSYQQIIRMADELAPLPLWRELETWMDSRLPAGR